PEFLLKYSLTGQIEGLLNEAISLYPDSPYIYYRYADIYYKMADYHKSIKLLEECILFGDKTYNPDLVIDPAILNKYSYQALAKCYHKLADYHNSAYYQQKAEQHNFS